MAQILTLHQLDDDPNDKYGSPIFLSTSLVVRMIRGPNVQVFHLHKIELGNEIIPKRYISGQNYLEFHLRD